MRFVITDDDLCEKSDAIRPNCIDCGSGVVLSYGHRWKCRTCGRKWQKVYRPLKVDRTGRPDCPFCNSSRINSHSSRWLCVDCGKTFKRHTK